MTTGDYEALLEKVNENLAEAAKHASNDLEKNMIKEYIEVHQYLNCTNRLFPKNFNLFNS